jgi:hypothetical protein
MLAGAYLDAMARGVQFRLVIPGGVVLRILALMDLGRRAVQWSLAGCGCLVCRDR